MILYGCMCINKGVGSYVLEHKEGLYSDQSLRQGNVRSKWIVAEVGARRRRAKFFEP